MKPYPNYQEIGIEWIGEIPSEWKVIRFKYALSLITYTAGDNNLIKIGLENISSWNGQLVETGSQFEGSGIFFSGN